MKKLFFSLVLGTLIAICWLMIIHTLKWIAIRGNEPLEWQEARQQQQQVGAAAAAGQVVQFHQVQLEQVAAQFAAAPSNYKLGEQIGAVVAPTTTTTTTTSGYETSGAANESAVVGRARRGRHTRAKPRHLSANLDLEGSGGLRNSLASHLSGSADQIAAVAPDEGAPNGQGRVLQLSSISRERPPSQLAPGRGAPSSARERQQQIRANNNKHANTSGPKRLVASENDDDNDRDDRNNNNGNNNGNNGNNGDDDDDGRRASDEDENDELDSSASGEPSQAQPLAPLPPQQDRDNNHQRRPQLKTTAAAAAPPSDQDELVASSAGGSASQAAEAAASAATNVESAPSARAFLYRAPFFTSWFVSIWNIAFMPIFTIISSCCFRAEDSTTNKLLA